MKQLFPGLPLIFDDNNQIIGVRNGDGTIFNFVLSLTEDQTPADGVQASLTSNMTNANADLTLTSVDYGVATNDISIVYVDPAGNNKSLSVSVSGKAITVSLATGVAGAITSTANAVKAAIDADASAAALVTVAVEGTGLGVVNAKTVAKLTGGVDVTPGPIGCLCFKADDSAVYRKTAAQTWTVIAAPPA